MGDVEVEGKEILVVEDIVDTGRSMSKLLEELKVFLKKFILRNHKF